MGLVIVSALLWGLMWVVSRHRRALFAKLPAPKHALVLLFFAAMALFAALVALADYGGAHARAGLSPIRTVSDLRATPEGVEVAVVGHVSPDLPLAYYDRFVVYTEHGNPATEALLSGTPGLTIVLPNGEQVAIANTSYRIADWHADGMTDFVYGLMRDDPVVVHAVRSGDRLLAKRVLLGTHDEFVAFERRSVVLSPYFAVVLVANALAWTGLAVAGFLAVRRRVR